MASNIKQTNSEELSYLDIVRRQGDIKIPLIQRDYAQGRPGNKVKDIREKFIKDLYDSVIANRRLNLDFVYGTTDNKRFIPLDGQQRLTTLFLIHIYLDGLRGREEEELNFRFSYETRDSSRIFCEKIIANRFSLFNASALKVKTGEDGKDVKPKPSGIIHDQSWWIKKWDSDPTIDGILRMLDTIDSFFFDKWKEAAANLFSDGNKTILFQFLKLEDFYDPDDLFIKMNARGLPLTDFEIFKGKWMEQIEASYPPSEVKDLKSKIDVTWTDFLWPMRRLREGLKNVDPFYRNLLKLVIGNSAASLSNKKLDFDILFEANQKDLTFSYSKYTEEYGVVFDKPMLDRITEELNEMCNDSSIFTKFRNGILKHDVWINLDDAWKLFVIEEADSERRTYARRVAIYALSRFSKYFPTAIDPDVNEWSRLIRNLLENTQFDSSEDAIRTIRGIDAMLEDLLKFQNVNQCGRPVNTWLAQTLITPSGFNKDQWEEEKIKAELRKDSVWDASIIDAEQHAYLRGKIGIILWCAGEIGGHTPFNKALLKKDFAKFTEYKAKVLALFTEVNKEDSRLVSKFLFVKAMLVKGDYMPWLSASRCNIYNRPGHRDYSWRALFSITDKNFEDALKFLKDVLDDKNFNSTDVVGSLSKIAKQRIGKGLPYWRRILTSAYAGSLLKHSHQGFIAFDGDNLLIYGSSRRSGWHTEATTLYVEQLIKHIRKDVQVSTLWNTGTEGEYGIIVNGTAIYYWDGQWYNDKVNISSPFALVSYIRSLL